MFSFLRCFVETLQRMNKMKDSVVRMNYAVMSLAIGSDLGRKGDQAPLMDLCVFIRWKYSGIAARGNNMPVSMPIFIPS